MYLQIGNINKLLENGNKYNGSLKKWTINEYLYLPIGPIITRQYRYTANVIY